MKDVFFMVVDGYEKVMLVYEEMLGWIDNIFGVIEFEVFL